jgi:hypothetical protein
MRLTHTATKRSTRTRTRAQKDNGGKMWGAGIGLFAMIGAFYFVPGRALPFLALALLVLLCGVFQDALPQRLKMLALFAAMPGVVAILWAMAIGAL